MATESQDFTREVTVSTNRQVGLVSDFARRMGVGPRSRLLETLSHTVRFCETGEATHARRVRDLAPDGDAVEKLESALVASIKGAEDASDRMPLLRLIPEVERVMDQCRKIVDRVEYSLSGHGATLA